MTETELKLEILASDLDTLLASGLLGAPTEVIDQRSTYFDTSNHRLFSAGFTLRIRHSGSALVQTVKATGASASLFARSEWEVPVTGNAPVLDHSTPLLNAFGPIGSELSPRFEVCIQRRLWIVKENESTIEAVIDTGRAKAGDRQTPIVEMELELKDGDARDLFTLARKIDAIVPYKFGVISKAERGYRLLQALSPAVKAEPVELERSMSMADAFPAIAGSCLRQFRLNEGIFLERKNAEALHQARISLRRLRSTLSVFKPLFPDETAQRMSDEFRWLAGVLGEARNIDVLLPKADILRAQLENVRATAYADVVEALASPRTRTLMLDFQEWLRCGDYLDFTVTPDIARPSATEFAVEALDRLRRKLKKHGRDLAEVDDQQRHEARKDSKKLRYAAEFFGSLFADKRGARRYRRFIAAMETLQDKLGALNDLATRPDVLDKHGLRDHPEAEKLMSHADKSSLIRKAQDALDDVVDAKRFWRC